MRLSVIAAAGLALSGSAAATDLQAEKLADAVMAASGAKHWPSVREISFTFNVEESGKKILSARHEWNVAANSDTVTWNGQSAAVDLNVPPESGTGKQAYQRWINDAYWLLAPLKLRDRGTRLRHAGKVELHGKTWEVIELSFDNVGLTPTDRYRFYIDPAQNLIGWWDYMPTPDKKVSGSWEKYQDFGGLKLATEHSFGNKRIFFTDVLVKR